MALFWYGLLLKVVLTASIVVTASVVVERAGPFIGALIAALPTAAGAVYIILAIEHPPAFIAASALGSMVIHVAVGVFALTYAVLAQRFGLIVSLGVALLVWFASAFVLRLVEWTPLTALLLNIVTFSVTIWASAQFRTEGITTKVKATARDIAWRAAVVVLCVALVTTASDRIGAFASGMFALFPVAMGSFFIILHPRLGGPAAASVAAHVQAPLLGLCLGFLAVNAFAESLGVWWSYAIGLTIGVAWSALLSVLRQRRRAYSVFK